MPNAKFCLSIPKSISGEGFTSLRAVEEGGELTVYYGPDYCGCQRLLIEFLLTPATQFLGAITSGKILISAAATEAPLVCVQHDAASVLVL